MSSLSSRVRFFDADLQANCLPLLCSADENATEWSSVVKMAAIAECDASRCPTRKVEKAVGLVREMEVGGDGNAYVVLKDPSGSVGATVDSQVLGSRTSEKAKIAVGSVLILEKVSVFSPDDRVQFLCITHDNITQVFS